VCTVWFYSPAKDRVTGLNVVNKIVASLDPPFCHVELQFPNGEACSIVMNGRVSMRERSFDPEFYTGVRVEAPAPAVGRALALARGHVKLETAFGVTGARTFCSKLVADLLRESGMVPEEELRGMYLNSPSALHRRLTALTGPRLLSRPNPRTGPLVPIDFAESTVQPDCQARYKVSAVAFSGQRLSFRLPCTDRRQNEKMPEEDQGLLF